MRATPTAVFLAVLITLTACGSNNLKTPVQSQQKPLDPQGNWIFSLQDQDGAKWSFTGRLLELNPPTVTIPPDGLWGMADCHVGFGGLGYVVLSSPAQVTGTNSITFNLVSDSGATQPAAYMLTGTIADDQKHMSGTYTGTSPCGVADPTGPWTAHAIPPVTGNWTGSNITASLTEDPNTGAISGTVTLNGTYNTIGPLMVDTDMSEHWGEWFGLAFAPSGMSIGGSFTTDENTTTATGLFLIDNGSPLDQQQIPVTMYRQQ
jgi:hypothetical protein